MLKIIVFSISILSFSILIYIVGGIWFRGKRSTYLKLFFAMGLTHSFWVLFNGINILLSEELYAQVYPFVMIGACILPHIMLRYVLYFTESRFAQSRLIFWIFTILPILDLLLLMTNPWHHEFIAGYDGIRPLGGRLFPVHAIMSYIPLLIWVVVLLRYIIKNIRKTPSLGYVGLGIFIPLVLNVLYTFNVFDLGFDITPYAFLMMFALFTMYSVRLRLFNIKETAITSLFTSLSDAFLVVDNSGLVAEANPAFINAFPDLALETDKTTAKAVANFLESITILKKSEDVFSAFCSPVKEIQHAEITVSTDGEQRNYSLSKDIIMERGQYAGFIITLADISNYRQMINEINEQNARLTELKNLAESASIAKSEFLSRMSHEIRTPLNAIIGMTQVALKSTDDEKTIFSINEIMTASTHLLGLLNDVLDMAKIESGKFEMAHEPFKLITALDEVVKIISQRCLEKNIQFNIDFGGTQNIDVLGDKLRLKQVILNLLGNAVKFTPEGGKVGLSMNVAEESKTHFDLDFVVTDNGIGIAKEQISRLFNAFEQADTSISVHYGGTGLGLAISQNLIGKMGGQITVQSEIGKGSVFSFTIRLEKTEEKQKQTDVFSMPELKGKRLLLVEDVEINRIIIKELLDDTHIEIEEVEDGQQAVDKFMASPVDYYDIVFMDVQMPNMDGYEASVAIRGLDRPDAKGVPIIALTANAFKDDIERALSHGMNAHIAKPVEMDKLLEVLFRFLSAK